MSNLTYNPNVNIPYHSNQFDNNYMQNDYELNEPMNNFNKSNRNNRNNYDDMDIYNKNNFRNNFENNFENNYEEQRGLPQMNARGGKLSRYSNQKNDYKKNDYKKKYATEKYENDDDDDEKDYKVKWIIILKKIVIFTALFLLISSVKMDELVCKFIPYLNENQLICMTIKGIILSILIIITQLLL